MTPNKSTKKRPGAESYPKNINTYKEVYGYGGNRVYQISEDDANEITKEFPKDFRHKPPFAPLVEGEKIFYMNINRGEQHIIFTLDEL